MVSELRGLLPGDPWPGSGQVGRVTFPGSAGSGCGRPVVAYFKIYARERSSSLSCSMKAYAE